MQHLLDPDAQALLRRERALLRRLEALLEGAGSDPETVRQLADLAEHVGGLFLVVVVGEFNAGKSTVLNALFGERLMREGPTPTTDKITLLRYGDEAMTRQLSDVMVERRVASDLLKNVALVDTPGTNSIVEEHQRVTEDFIPRSDLVLFVTSYDRPLTGSEQRFLEFIREDWGRALVMIINKADQARSEADLREVIEHVQSGCAEKLGFEPRVFAVSAALAFEAKTEPARAPEDAWTRSRFEPLEQFIRETLAGPERLALKLAAPLEAAERILHRFGEDLDARRRTLTSDEENLAAIRAEIEHVRADLENSYARHLGAVDTLLRELQRRGLRFLDDAIRVSRIGLLRDKARFQDAFERQVVAGVDHRIEEHVAEAVDDLTARALTLERQTLRRLAERMRQAGPEHVVEGDFSYNRAEVQRAIMREAEREIRTHDVEAEARRILENAHDATGLVQVAGAGAAGLGVLSGVLMVTTTADALGGFGLLTSGALAVPGLSVLPRQRRKAKRAFEERVDELREAVGDALRGQLDREIERAMGELHRAIAPYAAFVEEEQATLADATDERAALGREVDALRTEIETR